MILSSEPISASRSSQRPRVAAFGEWDTTNLGDRAIYEGVKHFFQEIDWEVVGYGLGTLSPVEQRADSPMRIPFDRGAIDTRSSLTDSMTHLKKRVKRPIRAIRQQLKIRALMPELRTVDAISVGGGALLADQDLHFPQSLEAITWAAKRLQIPLFCLGCGSVQDWSAEGRAMIQQFAETCQFIAVRDAVTSERLTALLGRPIPIFGDFALTLKEPIPDEANDENRKAVALNVMELFGEDQLSQKQYESALVNAIKHWLSQAQNSENTRFIIFTTGNPEDIKPARRVFQELSTHPNVELHLPICMNDIHNILTQVRVVISARLHAAILAISETVPVISFAPGEVYRKNHNFFKSIGIAEYAISTFAEDARDQLMHLLNQPQPQLLSAQRSKLDLSSILKTRSDTCLQFRNLAALRH
ncbi:polysaccharide pyruvyl transferase family protein [Egbenema bharatensis]|uniref:polysaccharide pyruvyl transferase family protein n=1 Tax=Egbenema bharatensis TaxID=3463334 RepID=UPI003A8BEA77